MAGRRERRSIILVVAMVAIFLASGDLPGQFEELDNGARILLSHISSILPPEQQRVAVLLLLDIGEEHDPEGRSGLAHLIEHLLITSAAGEFEATTAGEWMARHGGQCNAQTSGNTTLIAEMVPPEKTIDAITRMAARLGDLKPTEEILEREKARLLVELTNMQQRIPRLAAANRIRTAVNPLPGDGRHGGIADEVSAITLEEVEERLASYYKASRMRLALVGPFDPIVVRAAIAEIVAPLPAGCPLPVKAKRLEVVRGTLSPGIPFPQNAGAFKPFVCKGWRAPTPLDDDYLPFLIAAARLLHRGIGIPELPPPAFWAPVDDPELFILTEPLEDGEDVAAAVERIDARMRAATQGPIKDIDHSRTQSLLGLYTGLQTVPIRITLANPYLPALIFARHDLWKIEGHKWRRAFARVTAEDLEALAEDRLAIENSAWIEVR